MYSPCWSVQFLKTSISQGSACVATCFRCGGIFKCQHQILHIHWSQHVTSAEISARTCYGLHQKTSFVSIRPHTSAHSGDSSTQRPIHCQVGLASGRSLGRDWRHRPGRPHARWTDQLRNDTGSVPANLWRQTGHPTEPWLSDATARADYAMMTTTRTGSLITVYCKFTAKESINE